jgi:hypothetical protein
MTKPTKKADALPAVVADAADPKRKRGRPSAYTEELGAEICERTANGELLAEICRDERMPPERTVRGWALNPQHGFSAAYARAREIQWHGIAESMLSISDDGTNDWTESRRPDGSTETVFNHEHVQRTRLRVDTRKWLLSKMLPKQFGDRTTLAGDPSAPLMPAVVDSRPTVEDLIRQTLAQAGNTKKES